MIFVFHVTPNYRQFKWPSGLSVMNKDRLTGCSELLNGKKTVCETQFVECSFIYWGRRNELCNKLSKYDLCVMLRRVQPGVCGARQSDGRWWKYVDWSASVGGHSASLWLHTHQGTWPVCSHWLLAGVLCLPPHVSSLDICKHCSRLLSALVWLISVPYNEMKSRQVLIYAFYSAVVHR